MKLKFWQKLYLSTLLVFLFFFNAGIFVIVSSQNTKALNQQKESFLTQQEYILQQMTDDISLVYDTRPLGIPLIIGQYGDRNMQKGVLMQVKQDDETIYSSFNGAVSFENKYLTARRSEIKTINRIKYFIVQCNLPSPFESYGTVVAFPIQEFFDNWNSTVVVINIICCVVSAVTALVLYNLLKTLTKPIRELNSAAIAFGKGDMDTRIEKITDDEIGETAQNFNIMAEQICNQMHILENTAKEKQSFIDDFSHEMRTPLTAIRGYSQYMQQAKITGEEYYNTLDIIDHNAHRLQNLSESMLVLSLSENSDDFAFEKINMNDVFNNIKMSYLHKVNKNRIKLSVSNGENICICGDVALVESLIGNLVDNAINACNADENKEEHFINLAVTAQNGKVRVTVSDNGIGMDKETLEKVHQPFFRQDKARSRKNGGAGLGGSITKKIADLHGAKISYQSYINIGTKATVEFTAWQSE